MAKLQHGQSKCYSESESAIMTADSDTEGSTSAKDCHSPQRLLLDVLRAPLRLELACKHGIVQNLPHNSKRHNHNLKGVTPVQIVRVLPSEFF